MSIYFGFHGQRRGCVTFLKMFCSWFQVKEFYSQGFQPWDEQKLGQNEKEPSITIAWTLLVTQGICLE